jgi:putative membrane protein
MVQRPSPKWDDRSGQYDLPLSSTGKNTFDHLKLWIHPFTRFHQIPVFERVWVYVAIIGVYTLVVHWVLGNCSDWQGLKDAAGLGYVSIILGVLLVFRTNSAYERWSEGRKLWGQLTNDSRNLALKISRLMRIPQLQKQELGELIVSFAYSLKHHLRESVPSRDLPGLEPMSELLGKNIPVHVADKIFAKVGGWKLEGKIDGIDVLQLEAHLRAFMDICGSCERIRSTPLALSYRAFMRQGIAINLLIAPFYVSNIGLDIWWKLPIIMSAAYFLIGLEMIAEDTEEPFGKDGDDLPLDIICANIQKTIDQILPPIEASDRPAKRFTSHFAQKSVDPLKNE